MPTDNKTKEVFGKTKKKGVITLRLIQSASKIRLWIG